MMSPDELLLSHVGWMAHEPGDDVARYLREGWFEHIEQALWWLYLREGDTVIDCGAHVGLFTLLAARCVGPSGRVLAIEPNPDSATLLRRNVDALGESVARIDIVQAAAASAAGSLTLHAGAGRNSAYSSAVAAVEHADNVRVAAITIDDLLRERGVNLAALLKIDVEGAELDVWKGCAAAIRNNRLPLIMVEFTEANQRAAGLATMDLIHAWEADGYRFHRFNPQALRLEPAQVDAPIEYENLFATRDVETINQRMREAGPLRQRIARDIIARGETAHAVLKRACEGDHFRDLVNELRSVVAELKGNVAQLQGDVAGLNARLIEAIKRGDLAERDATLLRQRVHAYAEFIHQTINSRPLRLLYALRLAQPPGFQQQVLADLPSAGTGRAAQQ
jgi:FkbM family methyltransferase